MNVEVLVVDDEATDLTSFVRGAKRAKIGHKISAFGEPEEVIRHLSDGSSSDQTRFVLVSDLKMPKLSGVDLLQRIQPELGHRVAFAIMMSSSELVQDISDSFASGAGAYIVKGGPRDETDQTLSWLADICHSIEAGTHIPEAPRHVTLNAN